MRWNLKRAKMLFALIPAISIVFFILTSNNNIFADQSFAAFDIYMLICDTAQPQEGKNSPRDYDAAENFAIAADVYYNTDSVQGSIVGTVNALGGFYTQKVQNYHAKTGGHIFTESISLSAIASVAEQRYFKDGALLYRKGETSGSTVTGWANGVTELAPAVYRQRYGIVPQEITKYSVRSSDGENEGSIISGSLVSENADGTFTYELVLNGELAQKYSRYEMMTFAGVTEYPEFISCKLVYTIDSDWRVLEIKSYDTYEIAIMNGIRCESSLTETFTYTEGYMPERAQIFKDYVPTGNTGNIDVQKGPSEYLSEAFGDYIAGVKPLCLTAKAALFGETLDIAARIDVKANDFRFKIGNDIFAAYSGGEVYAALGENKLRLSVADLSPLLNALGVDLGGISFDANILDVLFANHTITETDTHVHILMPFELMGIKLNVDMGLKKTDDGSTVADTITANVNLGGVSVDVDILITDGVALPELKPEEYVSVAPMLNAAANALAQKSFGVDLNASIQTNKGAESLSGKIHVSAANGLEVAGAVSVSNAAIEFVYKNDTVYLSLGELNVMLPLAEAKGLLDSALEVFGSLDEFVKNITPFIGKDKAEKIVALLKTADNALSSLTGGGISAGDIMGKLNFLLPEISVNNVLELLCGAQISGNSVTLPVTAANGNAYTLMLKTNGDDVAELGVKGLEIFGINAEINAAVTFGEDFSAEINETDYVNVSALKSVLAPLPALLKAQNFTLDLSSGYLDTSAVSGELSGKIQLSLSPLTVTGKLKFRNVHDITFMLKDQTLYAAINDIRIKLALSDVSAIAEKINKLIPQNGQDGATVGDAVYSAARAASLIQNALGGKTLADVLSYVSGFAANDKGGVTVSAAFGDFAADVAIWGDNKSLNIDAYNLNYGNVMRDSRITAALSPAAALDGFEYDLNSFCDLAAVSDYVEPIFNTVNQKYFNIEFGGNVLDSRNVKTEIDGELKVRVTEGFADIYARVTLSGKTGDQNVVAYLIDGTDYAAENAKFNANKLRAYLDYNGFVAKIDYESVLRIVGALRDILNIKSDLIDGLVKDVYNEHLDASVFETMNIAGLDSIRDMLNALLGTADDVGDSAASGGISSLLGLVSDTMLDSVLSGVSLKFNSNGFLEISVKNSIFDPLNKGVAAITLGHNGELLTNVGINDLTVNGNTVNFNAELGCEEFEFPAEPNGDNVKDFSSIDELLIAVIKTASLKEFEITGKIKLNLLGIIKPEVPFNVKVKILDDGSTVAAVKLEVPYTVFGTLKRTDSYIYFANDMLYFIVDVWDNGAFSAGNYKSTEMKSATVEEFLANPVDYLFYLLRMSDTVANPVKNAMSGGGGGTPSKDLNDILKAYSYNAQTGDFTLKVGLKELSGSKDLNDLNITLRTTDGYVSGLKLDTKFTDMNITLSLEETVLGNLNVQDGKVLGANKIGNVSFGKSASGLGGSIDDLEDYLAVLFPVEAAETFGKKASEKAERANAAANKANESSQKVADCVSALANAQKEYAAAAEKLNKTPEGSFGYKRAEAAAQFALKTLERAREDLEHAKQARVNAALGAVNAAQSAYYYAQKAAEFANKAAEKAQQAEKSAAAITKTDEQSLAKKKQFEQTAARGYAAAGSAALGTVTAIQQTTNAIECAVNAASAAGDDGAEVLEKAESVYYSVLESINDTAANAARAATLACEQTIITAGKTVQNAAAKADEAQSTGDCAKQFEAATLAGDTLTAIETMNTANRAASLAALISGDDELIAAAQKNAEAVRSVSEQYALTAAEIAVNAANAIATRGKELANETYGHAVNGDTESTKDGITNALAYAQAALGAAESAQAAAKLVDNEQIAELAQAAADNAQNAAMQIGDKLLSAAGITVTRLFETVNSAQADISSLSGAQTEFAKVAQFVELAADAKKYAGNDGAIKLIAIYETAVNAANRMLTLANETLFAIAETSATALSKTVSEIGVVNYGTGDFNKIKDHANKLASAIDGFDSSLFTLTESVAATANGIYGTALPLINDELKQTSRNLLYAALNDGNTLAGAMNKATAAISAAISAANRLCEYSEKLKAPWYDISGISTTTPAKKAATSAQEKANELSAAAEKAASALDSLGALYKSLFA